MTNATKTAPLYLGMTGGEITCAKCAGYTLRESIHNAKAGQTRFTGLNGEHYVLTSENELGTSCEYC
jgi:hypothetical protein